MPREGRSSWSGIFAGTFVFLAIEITFGLLGAAIFATPNGNSAAGGTVTSMNAGMGVWMVVLSIIALYFAGRAASHLSRCFTRLDGMYQGLVTFGMSIFASILVAGLAVGNSMAANANVVRPMDAIAANGYWLFVALLLGGIAACLGGAHSVVRQPMATVTERPVSGIHAA
jgi:hypothetical protein